MEAEKKFDEFFEINDGDDELPDDIMMLLDGHNDGDLDDGEWEDDEEDEELAFEGEIDYSNMPPLETDEYIQDNLRSVYYFYTIPDME